MAEIMGSRVCGAGACGEGVLVVRVALHAWGVGSELLAPPHLLFALSSWSFGTALISAMSLPLPRAAVNRPIISGASGAAHALALTCWPPGLQSACVTLHSIDSEMPWSSRYIIKLTHHQRRKKKTYLILR